MGVDLAAPRGTPVRAVADGWVSETGWMGGLGRAVRLEHVGDRGTTYGHLVEVAPGIKEGVTVEQGQVIGYAGSTGLATRNHPHVPWAGGRTGARAHGVRGGARSAGGRFAAPGVRPGPRQGDAGAREPDPVRAADGGDAVGGRRSRRLGDALPGRSAASPLRPSWRLGDPPGEHAAELRR